jgi:hypothetical protein
MFYVNPPTLPNQYQVEVRSSANSALSVQELAQLALDIKQGKISNVDISQFENDAFKSFINKKVGNNSLIALRVCKGCHGG